MKKLKLEELGRLSVEEFKASEKLPVVLLLDNVRSLHNVGSAFRSADAFSVEKIFLTGITGTPPHREIQKTALGATESVAWEYSADPLQKTLDLKQAGYRLFIIEQTSKSIPLQQFIPDPSMKFCLIFGNEVDGVSEKLLPHVDGALEIPQAGTKHSINVSVCIGVVVWEFYRKLILT